MADHKLSEYDNKVDLGRCSKAHKTAGAADIKPGYVVTGYGQTDEKVINAVNTNMNHQVLGLADLMPGKDIDTANINTEALDINTKGKAWCYIKGSSGNISTGDKIVVSSTAGLCTRRGGAAAATVTDTTQIVGVAQHYLANSADIQCLMIER